MEVPETNPWARPPPPVAAEPPAEPARSRVQASASSRAVQHAPAKPSATDALPLSPNVDRNASEEPPSVDAAPPAAAPAPAAPGGTKRCSCCSSLCRVLSAAHRCIATSPSLSGGFVGLVGLTSLGLFAYSCALLPPSPTSGPCASDICGSGPIVEHGSPCVAAVAVGESCATVCASFALSKFVPFRFAAVSGHTSTGYVMCPFPAANTNWRIPLALFEALLCGTSLLMLGRGWLRWHALAFVRGRVSLSI